MRKRNNYFLKSLRVGKRESLEEDRRQDQGHRHRRLARIKW